MRVGAMDMWSNTEDDRSLVKLYKKYNQSHGWVRIIRQSEVSIRVFKQQFNIPTKQE